MPVGLGKEFAGGREIDQQWAGSLLELVWRELDALAWSLGAGGIGGAFGETGPLLRLLPGAQEAGREEMRGKQGEPQIIALHNMLPHTDLNRGSRV